MYANLLKLLAVAGVSLAAATNACAERVQYSFTAENAAVFSQGNGSIDPETVAGGLRNGDSVRGTFSFDTGAAPDVKTPGVDIESALYMQNISMNVVFNRTNYRIGSDSASITMVDGHSTKPWSYYYDSFAVDGPAQLFLRRGNGDVFSDTSLPTSLSLSSFDDAKFYYFYYSPTDFAWVAFTAQITTLNRLATAVPEPTSYAMFGLGLCLLGLVLRRKSGGDRVLAA